jgi:hypothetical protein
LLVHLAKVDNQFERSERVVLSELLRDHGLDESYLEIHKQEPVDIRLISELPGKAELFYWVMRMIKADNYLHPDELAYSKLLAIKLKFKPEAVDYFGNVEMPEFPEFEEEMKRFETK